MISAEPIRSEKYVAKVNIEIYSLKAREKGRPYGFRINVEMKRKKKGGT